MKSKEIVYGKNLFKEMREIVPANVRVMERIKNGLISIGIRKGNHEMKMLEMGLLAPIKYTGLVEIVKIAVEELDKANNS